MRRIPILLLALFAAAPAFAQNTLLQGGPWTPGHAPMYVGQGSGQAVVEDSGPAGGGGSGVGLSELGITARGSGTPPYVAQGTGPFNTNSCNFDAPINNPSGYHFLCTSPNTTEGGLTGGLITYGAGGLAGALPLTICVNGTCVQPAGGAIGLTVGATTIGGGSSNCILYDVSNVLGCVATGNNGVLITGSSGIPSIATVLPGGLTAPLKNLNNIRFASQYGGADWCANLVLADADLGSNPGTIIIDSNQTINACSPVSAIVIAPYHTIKFTDGATYALSQTIQLGLGSTIEGVGSAYTSSGVTVAGNKLLWTGATSGDMIKFFDTRNSQLINVALDCNGVSGANGIHVDSDNSPPSASYTFRHFVITKCHTGILFGAAGTSHQTVASCNSNPAQSTCTEMDFATISDFQINGSCTDLTAEGLHINSYYALQQSVIERANMQCVNIGVHQVFSAGAQTYIRDINAGSAVGTTPVLIKTDTGGAQGMNLSNIETEGGFDTVHDSGCSGSGANRIKWSTMGSFGHATADGCQVLTSISNAGAGTFTVGGTASVISINDQATWVTASSGVVTYVPSPSKPLAVGSGGTGDTSFNSYGLIVGEGTAGLNSTAALTAGQLIVGQTSADPLPKTMSGDGTMAATGAFTLNTVNSNIGTFGSATSCVTVTNNAKGLTTAISAATCTPAIGSITGLGTGVATALGNAPNNTGGVVTFSGNVGASLYTSLHNTASNLAPITIEQAGGDLLAARFSNGNSRFVIGAGGGSGSTFAGGNLVWSGSGNVWNFDITGSAFWFGNLPGGTDAFYMCGNTGTAGASAGTDALTKCGLSISTAGNPKIINQLIFAGGTPTIASGACGTGTNGVITSGTNQSGLITIGAVATTSCTISFSATLSAAPSACILQPHNAAAIAATTLAYVSSISTSAWVITGSVLASTSFYYHCI